MADTSHQGANALAFTFSGKTLRVLTIDGEPWFVAADVCDALDHSDTSKAVSRLDDDEKLTRTLFVSGQNREVLVINESGLYSLILTSRKPEAKKFKKWVTSEVLPAIRKTGRFEATPPSPVHPAREELGPQDLRALQDLVHYASHPMRYSQSWHQGIWAHLRRATGNPAPAGWFVDQIPALGAEMGRILATCHQVAAVQRDIERVAVRRIFRRGEDAQAVLAHIDALAAEATQQIQGQLDRLPPHYITCDVQRFLARGREQQA